MLRLQNINMVISIEYNRIILLADRYNSNINFNKLFCINFSKYSHFSTYIFLNIWQMMHSRDNFNFNCSTQVSYKTEKFQY